MEKGVNYRYAGKKESITQLIRRSIPKEMYPTKKTGFVLGLIFVIVALLGLVSFPLAKLLSGDLNLMARVGWPMSFLVFDLGNPTKMPIRFWGLVVDFTLYIIIAYGVDVLMNILKKSSLFMLNRDKKKYPKVYKIEKKKQTLFEKAAEKTVKKVEQGTIPTKKVIPIKPAPKTQIIPTKKIVNPEKPIPKTQNLNQ
jgi:hypothetical protein